MYIIFTKELNASVERRYNDFYSLRQELIRLYPGFVVPPIPKKKSGKSLNENFLQKRKNLFQIFLDDLLIHPLLKRCTLTTQFLSMGTKEWENNVKTFGKSLTPKEVGEYRTLSGKAKVEIDRKSVV